MNPDALPPSAEVVIIGGGAMGTSIAFHLAEAGVRDVLLLEQSDLGSGSTCKAAGGVRAQFSDPINIALGQRGLTAFEGFPDRPGQDIDLRQPGYLFLLTSQEQVAVYEESVTLQNAMGVPTRMVDRDEIHRLNPTVSLDSVLAGSFHARDGFCSPESVVLGYATAARRHGATVRSHTPVTGIRRDGSQVTAVETPMGTVETGAVILAGGAWSHDLGAMAGVELPVEPLRRQILVTEPLPAPLAARITNETPMTIDADSTFYFHREGQGLLMGMSYQAERPGFRWNYSEDWLPELMTAMERVAPDLLDLGVAHRWVGMYEVTPDHNALLGEAPDVSRVLYACGFSGHGFLQAPAVGEVIRDRWLGREPAIDVSGFDAGRFAAGQHRGEVNIV